MSESSRGRSASSARAALAAAVVVVVVAAAAFAPLAGCSRPLPEQGTPVAELYVARCSSGCHRPHNPASMTAAMWQVQFARMEPVIARAGMPPLTSAEKSQLLAYLQRNAEGHVQSGK